MADQPPAVVAECPACGGRGFKATGESLQPGDILTCESCGLKLSYAFLQSRTAPAVEPAKPTKKRKAAKRRKRKGRSPA